MQLSREGASRQAQGTGFGSQQHQMPMHRQDFQSDDAHQSSFLPRTLFGDLIDGPGLMTDVDASEYLPEPDF